MIRDIIEFSNRNRLIVLLFLFIVVGWGYWALTKTPLDALPDLSDTQVIIYTEWPGRSPDLVENQITYPISSTLLAAPKVQVVRGFSYLGSSFIYVIFEEGTDIYWARSRVLEYLQGIKNKIPADVNPVLGPDATGLGWGFSYAVVDETGQHDLSELRSFQDYSIKLALESVPGVSQVASIGGYVKQYQITIDPNRLLSFDIPLTRVLEVIKRSNRDVEGRVIELGGTEYVLRGRGYIQNLEDLQNISLGTNRGTPIFLKDIARIQLGPEIRRGIADLDGRGEVAGGIVVVRFGENVLNVLEKVKEKIKNDIEPGLPKGMKIITTYDRSDLIYRSIDTLRDEIIKLCVAVSAVCFIFLLHLPSALVIILTLPVAIIISFICMYYLKVTTNIMSLSGIAIAIGAMVDASIIMVENAHKKLEEWERNLSTPSIPPLAREDKEGSKGGKGEFYKDRINVIIDAAKEVGPSLFFSLLVITVGFLPVFSLEAQAGRLFKPLAYTKTFAMLFASFLAITLTPVLMTLFIRGKIRGEEKNPVSRFLQKIYEPVALYALQYKKRVIIVAILLMIITIFPFVKLGSEFMPPLYEGSLFYMPVTAPGPSITEVSRLLQIQDKTLKNIPEVAQVFGKAGRAETATDPAPLEMFETIINLKPESEWRKGMTVDSLKDEMNDKLTIPGVANSFTMPIKARLDMLSTGIRTPVGLKVMGSDLETIEHLGTEIEKLIKDVAGTRNIYAERVNTGYFLDIKIKRKEAARYNLSVDDVLDVIQSALGGLNLTTTVEGRQRYPVNVRYARDLRDNPETIKRVLVPVADDIFQEEAISYTFTGNTAQVPLTELADIDFVKGPTVIKSEEGLLAAYIYIDFAGSDIEGYIKKAQKKIASIKIPEGYRIEWSGDYEYLTKTRERLKLIIPLTLSIVFVLLFLNTKSFTKTMIVLLAVPFSLIGSFWLLYLLNYNMSVATWVGIIALAGIDAETGVVMLLYLDLAYNQWKKEGRLRTVNDLKDAIMHGAVKRIRPKIMTVSVILAGLIPILFSSGIGSDVMKRIAAPMVGGIVTSAILELIIYPVLYMIWKGKELKETEESQSQ